MSLAVHPRLSVADSKSRSLGPSLHRWDDEDPFIVQAVAETASSLRDDALPVIIGVVRGSSVASPLGNPAYQPNNFSGNLATGTGPDDSERLDWGLPAHGAQKWTCGRFVRSKTYGCPEGHEIHAVRCSCHKLTCPACYPDAVARGAHRIAQSLFVVDQLNAGLAGWHHVIVSPPQEFAEGLAVTKSGFKALKGAVWEVLRGCGALGAVVLFHPYRQNDGTSTWRAGPHFHAIVYGVADSARRPEGWVVKDAGRVGSDRFYPLAYYILSHAGVSEGVRRVPSYYGACSSAGRNSPVKVAEFTQCAPRRCQCCGGDQFVYLDWFRAGSLERHSLPPVTERHTWRIWVARRDKVEASALLDGLDVSEALEVAYDRPWMVVLKESGPPEITPEEINVEGVFG